MFENFGMTIGGRKHCGTATFDVVNPATEEVIGRAPDCTPEELDAAVAAARAAFPGWSALSQAERQDHLDRAGDLVYSIADDLAPILIAEKGQPQDAAVKEIMATGYWLKSFAQQELPVIINEDTDERRSETRFLPLGVVGAIAPWNYPILLAIWKVAPALLAGNTIVVKPSPFTPLTTLKLIDALQAIFPPGVLSVVTGTDALGPLMTEHPGFQKISFTGSTRTGKRVMQSAGATLKRLTLELGGNDPAIIMPDVDIDQVAEKLFWAAFENSGQICIAVKRVYIHEAIYDRMRDALVACARRVVIGDGKDAGTHLGPVQNRQQYEHVKSLMEDCRQRGITMIPGSEVSRNSGYFIPVTFVDNPPEEARIVKEEQFGPVLPLMKFSSVPDVIARANDSEYGLAASVWTGDEAIGEQIAAQLDAGTVWVNEATYVTPFAAFGGRKQSGLGVENGHHGLLEYTSPQTRVVRKRAASASELS